MKVLFLSLIMAVNLAAQGTVDIIAAYFGMNDRFADVSNQVRNMAQNSGQYSNNNNRGQYNGPSFAVNLSTMGIDPAPNVPKVLRVYYRYNGQFAQGEWREGDTAQLNGQSVMQSGVQGGVPGSLRSIFTGNRNASQLQITRAVYGAGNQMVDVTGQLNSRIINNRLDYEVTNVNAGGDPAYGMPKTIQVSYNWQGRPYNIQLPEGQWLRLPDMAGQVAPVPALRIVSAQYGLGNRMMDVTNLMNSRVTGDRLSMPVNNNTMGGDPAKGDDKQLYVIYEVNGQRREARINEDQQLNIP
jgi:hypothetical protein